MCPEVRCPAVSADCQTIEYIVFQYDYEVRGRVINVRCESCEYCLDAPSHVVSSSRRRRIARQLSVRSSVANPAVSLLTFHIQRANDCKNSVEWAQKCSKLGKRYWALEKLEVPVLEN